MNAIPGHHWGHLGCVSHRKLQYLEVVPVKVLEVGPHCILTLILELGDATERLDLFIEVEEESIDPVIVFEMSIGLNQSFGQLQGAHLIESTVTGTASNLAKLGSQNVDDLPKCAKLKGVGGHAKDLVVHIEKLFLSQVCRGQEITL